MVKQLALTAGAALLFASAALAGSAVFAIILACVANSASTPHSSSGTGTEHNFPPHVIEWFNPVPTDIGRSDPNLMLRILFEIAGHEREEARELAAKVCKMWFGEEVSAILDWKRTDHHAAFIEALRIAGHEIEEAVVLSSATRIFLSGELPDMRELRELDGGGWCYLVELNFYYCDGEGVQRRTTRRISANCWYDHLNSCTIPGDCPGGCTLEDISCAGNCKLRFEIDLPMGCIARASGCVWVEQLGPPYWDNWCSNLLSCECISFDCENIVPICCPTGNPSCVGCPCESVSHTCDVVWPKPKE